MTVRGLEEKASRLEREKKLPAGRRCGRVIVDVKEVNLLLRAEFTTRLEQKRYVC